MATRDEGREDEGAPASKITIRPATLADVPALVALERRSFSGDWVSERSFRALIRRGRAALLVEEWEDEIRGYALLFFRRGNAKARLYSFAVAHKHRGRGLAKALLRAAEAAAREHGADALRLEVRADNAKAQALYGRRGYKSFGRRSAYYEDGTDALLMEKRLTRRRRRRSRRRSSRRRRPRKKIARP